MSNKVRDELIKVQYAVKRTQEFSRPSSHSERQLTVCVPRDKTIYNGNDKDIGSHFTLSGLNYYVLTFKLII